MSMIIQRLEQVAACNESVKGWLWKSFASPSSSRTIVVALVDNLAHPQPLVHSKRQRLLEALQFVERHQADLLWRVLLHELLDRSKISE